MKKKGAVALFFVFLKIAQHLVSLCFFEKTPIFGIFLHLIKKVVYFCLIKQTNSI